MSEIAQTASTLPVSETSKRAKADTSARAPSNSSAIWNRAVLLFGALCLIKFIMLYDLRKHLFEIHWRVAPDPITLANHIAFWLFAILVGLNLWVFSSHCERGGVRVVRGANACVLALGALFILLTFTESNQNYLSAVMNAYLDLKDLRWFLLMNFCFRWPYVMLWIAGYALIYYGLYRKKREHLVLRATAVCAAVYIALCLREQFLWYRETLVVLDCIGIATYIGARKATGPLRAVILLALLLSMVFFFVLFHGYDAMLTFRRMNREFLVLTACTLVLFTGLTLLARYRGFSIGWSWLLPFSFTTFLLFVNTKYVQANNYYNFLCVGLTLPRYFMGELAIALVWGGAAWAYRRWRPKGSLVWLDAILLILISIAVLDLRLAQIMSVRLDWQVLSLAFGETPKMMWRMSKPYLPSLAAALVVTTAVYAGLLAVMRWAALRRGGGQLGEEIEARPMRPGIAIVKWPLIAFVLLGLAGDFLLNNDKARGQVLGLLVTSSPMWQRARTPMMDAARFNKTARELRIWQPLEDGSSPKTVADPTVSGSAHGMNVVMIFQESTYNKYLSLFDGTNDTEPLLSKYKDRMELFPNFYSSFAGSINARFATFTGLYPVADFNAFTSHHVPVKSLFEVLHENGYSNSLFYSSYFDYTGFRDFLRGRDIDEMYDADTMPGKPVAAVEWGLREDETLGPIKEQIKKYAAAKQKFCLTYVPAAPHNPFDGVPDRFRKRPLGPYGDFTTSYLNELEFMDWVIASIVDQLKESGLLENTVIVITGDHGEMLGENNGPIGHGWALTPELGNVPLIVMNPKRPGYRVNDSLGSQVDMLPTVLDVLGIPLPADQLYQGTSLYSANADPNRTIYLNTFQQYGILQSGLLYCGNGARRTGGEGAVGFYSYANDGARTAFRLLDVPPMQGTNAIVSMDGFNKFQANFLHNYAGYCRMVRQTAAAK
jgi:arylsulfatase A-like enzyme